MSEENPVITTDKNISVNMTNIASLERQNLTIMEPKDVRVNVKISGKRNDVNKVTERDIIATVDLRGYKEEM